jgi:hypothetical protein
VRVTAAAPYVGSSSRVVGPCDQGHPTFGTGIGSIAPLDRRGSVTTKAMTAQRARAAVWSPSTYWETAIIVKALMVAEPAGLGN